MSETIDQGKKPRSNSKLDALTGEQRELLVQWLVDENKSYDEVRELVVQQFGVETNNGALSRFYARVAAPRRWAESLEAAEVVQRLDAGKLAEAAAKRAQELAFLALAGPRADARTAQQLIRLAGEAAWLKQADARIAIAERRVELEEMQYDDEVRRRVQKVGEMQKILERGIQSARLQAASSGKSEGNGA